ncbi:leucyl aminopeptidase [Acidocella sp. KAb 2-4]|uniref:leucyl aminopeptidase n=1 Tax=Acidocella sp. KAb 2-4 TaxID=2885158 RepID=UPI001D05DB54|nr:leucyl aminopeptidase [Acidocella sp. KAb 2-4]MCB5944464.1 leucyl aminopeptidase [Acidocella sp. KAb 2-4]
MLEISFAKPELPKSGVLVLPLAEGAAPAGHAAALDKALDGGLARALEAAEFKGKKGSQAALLAPKGYKRVLVLGTGKPGAARMAEALGGAIAAALTRESEAAVLAEDFTPDQAAQIGFGARLRAYRFDKYRTTQKEDEKLKLRHLTILTPEPRKAEAAYKQLAAVAQGVELTRDLVSEPANTLYPAEFAERIEELKKLGLKVEVFDEDELKKLGFGSMLAVAQGSARPARMAVLQWLGAPGHEDSKKTRKPKEPLVFVGKGVTFDTGGISLKPAAGMEDMKWDMAGAGAVVGLMAALAARKAKLDVVGLVGLVENMPSGSATRPGDVVKSYSGQTIEIINTDAEGRLVLADVLHYAQSRFAPKAMIDLATLTGAIIVGLGHEYAGLFSNDDDLAAKLAAAGAAVDEKLWRMPLAAPGESYDKELASAIADVKNVGGGRAGGSITAAQFLQRFVNGKPWAHLDIAGMAWASKDSAVAPKGATGFGVRLLDRFVHDNFEA